MRTTGMATTTTTAASKGRYAGQTSADSFSEELDRDEGEDEKMPGGPGLNERELWSLHRAVPGLRRHDPRTSTIRQHYYPEVKQNNNNKKHLALCSAGNCVSSCQKKTVEPLPELEKKNLLHLLWCFLASGFNFSEKKTNFPYK